MRNFLNRGYACIGMTAIFARADVNGARLNGGTGLSVIWRVRS